MLKIVGVIPARLASQRFPRKVLKEIDGKSLIQMTYENTLKSGVLERVIVASEDAEVVEHVRNFGGEAFLTGTHISGTDRVAEVVGNELDDVDIVVNVQADEPCLSTHVIDLLVDMLHRDHSAVVTTPIAKIEESSQIFNPSVVKCVFDENMRALYFSRSPIPYQQKKAAIADYYRHIGVYCFRTPFLLEYATMKKTRLQQIEDLEQLRILEHGYPLHVCVVEDQVCGVDTPEDLKKVEKYLCRNTSLSQGVLSPL